MSHDPHAPATLPVSATMAQLRRRKLEATQALLGDTIAITDEAWQQPSRLPGWTRAHVASHLARNADGLRRVLDGFLAGTPQRMYAGEADRRRDLERGSRRGALELQIDLDTSAGLLNRSLTAVEESGRDGEVELSAGLHLPVHHLAVARLWEVVVHHVDLDCGFAARDVDDDISRWLLQWATVMLDGRADVPPVELRASSGFTTRLGDPTRAAVAVRGSDADLFGWVSGRGGADALDGAAGIELPEF